MNRKLVIFDVEGTLVDCVQETLACWRETFRAHGFDFSVAELHRHSGRDPDDMIRILLGASASARLTSSLKEEQGQRYRQACLPQVKAFPEVRPLFETVRKSGHLTALATSCAKDELRQYLGLLGISEFVDAVACGDDVDHEKPHPDLIRIALARTDRGAKAIMVGDTPYDAEAAGGAGISAVGLMCGGFTKEELVAAGCRAVYRDPADLLEGLSGSPLRPMAASE